MRLLDRQDVLLLFEAQLDPPDSGDALRQDGPSDVGPKKKFRGTISSLKTEDAGEVESITTPANIRALLRSPPDESIFVKRVNPDGSDTEGELGSYLVGSSRPSAEIVTRHGSLLTVIHRTRGAVA